LRDLHRDENRTVLMAVNGAIPRSRMLAMEAMTMKSSQLMNGCALAIVLATLPLYANAAPSGRKVFEKTCTVCHSEGLSGAPRIGDRDAWTPRAQKGRDALLVSVRQGKGLMPPKGGNEDFSEEELRAAVDYILAAVKTRD
jgi:cytochrome c5